MKVDYVHNTHFSSTSIDEYVPTLVCRATKLLSCPSSSMNEKVYLCDPYKMRSIVVHVTWDKERGRQSMNLYTI